MKQIILFFLFLSICVTTHAQKMNNAKLGKIIKENSTEIEGSAGYWQFKYKNTYLLLITDEKHNRMRLITPIIEEDKLPENYFKNALRANFHTALDVKHALSEGMMWCVYIHPLKELSEEQIVDAMSQVYYGAMTFGSSYSSTDLVFPAKKEEKKEEIEKKDSLISKKLIVDSKKTTQ